jgi:uncharacterized membrane protein
MTKNQFINTLRIALENRKVKDIDEIISDYINHVDESIATGISESQSVKALGDIESIANDYGTYQKIHKNKRMFEIITSSTYAIPMLILLYATSILFMISTIASWSLGIYFIFQISTFSFIPTLMNGINLLYGALFISFSFYLFSVSIKFFSFSKNMAMQFYVKKDLRIGRYTIKGVYTKLFNLSLIITLILFALTFIISVIVTGEWEFWHYWQWFD